MTDNWSTQFGRIHDILCIPCESGDAIVEGSAVKVGTEAADKIVVNPSAALADGPGVALKAASAAGEVIPVMFHGVFKCIRKNGSQAIAMFDFVVNCITATNGATQVTKAVNASTYYKAFNGGSWMLGMALQEAAANGDYFLVLVGRTT